MATTSWSEGRDSGAVVQDESAVTPQGEAEKATPALGNASQQKQPGAELLRRLSLTEKPAALSVVEDLKNKHANLQLSGNVISAAICIPYKLALDNENAWTLERRHGTSALFDSFSYLSSEQTPWNHTLVAWTGEIAPATQVLKDEVAQGTRRNSILRPAVSKGGAPTSYNPHTDTVVVSPEARTALEQRLMNDVKTQAIPVWLGQPGEGKDANLYLRDQSRWRRYAEHELYTLFHYRQNAPGDGRAERKSWDDYIKLNQAFADRIIKTYQPGDIILVHDYHLMLLPSMLRQRLPNAYIGFFLHIPFPSSEYMRCLPRRKEILTGALGASMIGLNSWSFSRHFNSCCKRILGFESSSAGVDAYGAHVSVDVFPIGIDVAQTQEAAFGDKVVDQRIDLLRATYPGKKIIVGRDRLDTVRGVAQKLEAFEVFLHQYPEWRNQVVLIQVTSPTSVEEEKEDPKHHIETKVASLVSRINCDFGSLSHSPVQHYSQYLSAHDYFALLRAADVALITSVRDGMNTTSLEYVVCQRDNHGTLILSEFSGTAASLTNAVHINPWDSRGVAKALDASLSLSAQKKKDNHEALYDYVTSHDVVQWSDTFLERLLTNLTSFSQDELTPALDVEQLKQCYHHAQKRLFMFDYDGTLTPIVKDPSAAIPSDKVLRTLKTLAADPANQVWIISGRDEAFLSEWMGSIVGLGLSAEHGCFIRPPGGDEWENLTLSMDLGWQEEAMKVFNHYTERTQGSWVEKKRVALTWHYRQADPDFGAWQAQECRRALETTVAQRWAVEVMAGKANLEIRPTFVNKGFIASRLVRECGAGTESPPEFILCLGDDQTDEDMFQTLLHVDLPPAQVFACTVGASSKRTLARWHLLAPSDVINAVSELTKPYSARLANDPNDTAVPDAA